MIKTMRKSLALLLAIVISISFVPIVRFEAHAADVDYTYSGKYIYNWGTRGTTATFLSPNAEKFYDEHGSFDELSSYAGGTGKSDAPSSALYSKLKSLMSSAQTHITSYDETKALYRYTDCENNGGSISSFYSGKAIGPSWESGGWNREHTWPNSKGSGDAENDIMMLRPTSTSENSSRGNTAYGKSSGYYNPNSESGGKYDLRGDVARIVLYVYVRWGNTSYAWGQSGVMESVEVLLEWMEADPVDTWELGRNDSVESITGTRNVFVDYPELAFLLFGEDIPSDMPTPSSEGNAKCDHNNFDSGVVTAPTCTSKGFTLYTCKTAGCGYSYKTNTVEAKGHSYKDGTCTVCGASEPVLPTYVKSLTPGVAYKLGIYSTAKASEFYFTGTMTGYYGATDSAFDNGVDVYVENASGGYHVYFKNSSNQKQYINLVYTGTHYNFTFSTSASSVYTWDSSKNSLKTTVSGETCYIGTYGQYFTMGVLTSTKMTDTDYFARFYTIGSGTGSGSGSGSGSGDTTCQHNYNSVVTNPTCTSGGFTKHTCTLCGYSYTDSNTSATGHSYSDGTCISCGAKKPSSSVQTEASIGFSDKANRTEFSTTKQVWVMNGITITNNKASASSDVADYIDPIRFYKGSDVTIEYPGMTKIVIDCTGTGIESKHISPWLDVDGAIATATNSNGIVTIVLNSPSDSFAFRNLSAQCRAKSITVFAESTTPAVCEHKNTSVVGAVSATCTTDGHTGITRCSECSEVIDEGEVIPATGHDMGKWGQIVAPTCTDTGVTERSCKNCDHKETNTVAAIGHKDSNSDEICDYCSTNMSDGSGNSGDSGNGDNSDPKPNPDPDNSSSDENSDDERIKTVLIVLISIVGGGLLASAVLVFFIKKKH